MYSKSNNKKLSPKEYIFLVACLLLFFLTGLYLHFGGTLPQDINLVYFGIGGVIVAIPVVIFMLKNIEF